MNRIVPSPEPSEPAAAPEPSAAVCLTAFSGDGVLVAGPEAVVWEAVRDRAATAPTSRCLVFDDATGEQVDEPVRGAWLAPAAAATRGAGRPRLGVVAREVTLLPRHWEWLNRQPGGASVALRRLVEDARRVHREVDLARGARERAYRFMVSIAGDLPGYEASLRALFAGDRQRFDEAVLAWPRDVRAYAQRLAIGAWTPAATPASAG